jgi:FkbM family methyltransferase
MMIIGRLIHYFHNMVTLCRTFSGDYTFTARDRFIYLLYAESPGPEKKYPDIQEINQDDTFIRLKIGGYCYYWPKIFGSNGISYMHQEVFEPAKNNAHAYEYKEYIINNGDIVIDAGACEGFFTRYALERGARIISVEPVKLLAKALERTFHQDIAAGNVTIVNAALGSFTGQGQLCTLTPRIFESHLDNAGEEVDILRLDDLITTKIDFIKLDIEGGEVDALYGARNIIRKYRPKLSIAVYHKYENAQIIIEYLHEICPDYTIIHRGIYACDNEKPRPMMVYAG